MSNIKNANKSFLSVGIDIGADISWMSIALPNQLIVGKPLKITHSNLLSLEKAVHIIKEAEETYFIESRIFLESTGIYHYPLFCFFHDKGLYVSIIYPIITKNSTNINIRKVHNEIVNKSFSEFCQSSSGCIHEHNFISSVLNHRGICTVKPYNTFC